MKLRDYQQEIVDQMLSASTNDLVQLDTGGGKTPIIAELAKNAPGFIAVAHRNVLISQISATLARADIAHNAICTRYTRRRCIAAHRAMGSEWLSEGEDAAYVASVDSLLARHRNGRLSLDPEREWWIFIDEAHHALADNKWGLLKKLLPNARFIGFTATPARLDGQGLHADCEGLFDRLVQAPSLGSNSVNRLIQRGYLSDFKVYSPVLNVLDAISCDIDLDPRQVFGDVLEHFEELASRRQTVVMCPRIENAELTAEAFVEAGYAAAHVSSRMSQTEVARRIEAFREHRIQVLCNVDILGEGYDFPGIEAVIMLRKTASLVLFRQWVGRALRPLPGKDHAVIIDHMGNVLDHAMPDAPIDWSLEKIRDPRFNQLIPCRACHYTFSAKKLKCPECGEPVDVEERRTTMKAWPLEQQRVDWGLVEMQRQQVGRQEALAEQEARMAIEVVIPESDSFGTGSVAELCRRVRAWMVDQLEGEFPPSEINALLNHHDGRSRDFYIKHFTLADIRSPNPKKAKRVFRLWRKSL
ncbi:DEAD/DEAH box helicase [Halomonas piscis]|uniref:DEAD/DEAH box helicase n=1 Tax=Halomonas piscis TaxID=3031727 RepID=UPI00289DDFFA|nr:DEAD/DEAH box helicase [Halomonas piscis]